MIELLTALLLWLLVLFNPGLHQQATALTDCTFYEDGVMLCENFNLPAYEEQEAATN